MKEFVLNNLDFILSCVLALISITITIINIIRVKKSNKATEEVTTTAKAREKLMLIINQMIIDVEKLKQYSGEEKKQYVITRALEIANGLMTSEEIDTYIEEQVALSDKVNKNSKIRKVAN